MNGYFLKFFQRNLPFYLAIFLCAQCIPATLPALSDAKQSIEKYAAEKRVDQLLLLMQKRLAIMHEVARTTWVQNLPVEDKNSEQQVLDRLVEEASEFGLDEIWVGKFFQAQMDAAKEIQSQDISHWREHGTTFEAALSLNEDLRFYIDEINYEMIFLLSDIYNQGHCKINGSFILDRPISVRASDAIEDSVWQKAIAPLKD